MKNEGFKINTEQVSEKFLTAAYERAVSGRGQDQIDMDDFIDDYGDAAVQSDKKHVARLEERFAADATPETNESLKLATVLESIITEQIELSDWFGPSTTTRRTSRFDDVVNGVDAIAEIEQDNTMNHLALAIDVTYGTSLEKKFRRIKEEIEEGTLASVKYFDNEEHTFKGKLFKVPRVVLGIDRTRLIELAGLWLNDKKKELAVHPVQFKLLEEIRLQLLGFKKYASTLGRDDLVKIYERQAQIVMGIIKERHSEMEKQRIQVVDVADEHDRTFESIVENVRYIASLGAKQG